MKLELIIKNGEKLRFTGHVCRHCLGPVLARGEDNPVTGTASRFVCGNCGVEGAGRPSSICGCGIKVQGAKGAKFKCAPNPARGPLSPALYVVTLSGEPVEVVTKKPQAPANQP